MNEAGGADIGVTGLGVMGRNLARNLARHGHAVALHNRSPEWTWSLAKEHGDEGTFVPSESMADFVASLSRPRAIIVMVNAGDPTDAVIDELVPLLSLGDIVVDCGNAHYMDTRQQRCSPTPARPRSACRGTGMPASHSALSPRITPARYTSAAQTAIRAAGQARVEAARRLRP
jgi:predicted dinucleotide-binding enzyme